MRKVTWFSNCNRNNDIGTFINKNQCLYRSLKLKYTIFSMSPDLLIITLLVPFENTLKWISSLRVTCNSILKHAFLFRIEFFNCTWSYDGDIIRASHTSQVPFTYESFSRPNLFMNLVNHGDIILNIFII